MQKKGIYKLIYLSGYLIKKMKIVGMAFLNVPAEMEHDISL